MRIEHCKRCDGDWCYRGVGRALRCGKCKSPYWDREPAVGHVETGKADCESVAVPERQSKISLQTLRDICEKKTSVPRVMPALSEANDVAACGSRHFNDVDGEWYTCGKSKHAAKVPHGNWSKE